MNKYSEFDEIVAGFLQKKIHLCLYGRVAQTKECRECLLKSRFFRYQLVVSIRKAILDY